MAVFTAYVAAVLRWCEATDTVVQFQSDGRSSAGTKDAIGSFACSIYVRVRLLNEDNFLSLLQRVTDEFCAAYEHQDRGYLAAQVPPPPWTRNTVFNWMPAAPEPVQDPEDSPAALKVSPLQFPNPWLETLNWDNEPTTALYEVGGEITGSVHFALNEHSTEQMVQFGQVFLSCLVHALEYPAARIHEI